MPEQNSNYVPVDWASSPHPDDPRSELGNDGLTDEEREAGIAPMFEPPIVIDTGDEKPFMRPVLEAMAPEFTETLARTIDELVETATLNSAGDPIKIGDRVRHICDAGLDERSVGIVKYVGPVEIIGTVVENGVRCSWDGAAKEESHHADQLTVLL